jgi:two-component system response regulator YesN
MRENLYHIVKRARRYIDENYASQLTLNLLSENLNISPYYLSHIFKNVLDVNVIEYLNSKRIEAAKKLLVDTDMAIKNISCQVGYLDSNYFCRVFKRYTNITPSVFRTMNRNSDEAD